MQRLTRTPTRTLLTGLVALVLTAGFALLLSAWLTSGGEKKQPARAARGFPAPPVARNPTKFSPRAAQAGLPRDVSVIARARGRQLAVFGHPGARRPALKITERRLDGHRIPLVFLVTARRPGWVRAYLPVRPNRRQGWIRESDVTLAQDPYRIRVNLKGHRIEVWKGRRKIERGLIATGKALSPTPTGRYYVTDIVKPPDPKGFYGPYAFGLSAFSPVYTSFEGGKGQVGIHGTSDPSALGRNVSHGCIRVANAAITRLARRVPIGTPVDIVRS